MPAFATDEMGVSSAAAPLLEILDLRVDFRMRNLHVPAVAGVNLKIDPGKTMGLVGESGCGKSVTALSIMRLIPSPPGQITSGEILFSGQRRKPLDLARLPCQGNIMRSLRGGEISMIFQEPMTSLNPLYTVGSQIAESIRLHQNVGKGEAMDRALEMLSQVHIGAPKQRLKEYPHQLSGGMRQRVMIALALACHPSLLIADEATTALDVTVQARILDLMRQLQSELGTAILLITHNLGVVAQVAHSVSVMYLGRVVESAPTRALFHRPLHPYTQGLLHSVPVFGKRRKRLEPISGTVPSPSDAPSGCAFYPRCPRRLPRCERKSPSLVESEKEHLVSCWLYREEE